MLLTHNLSVLDVLSDTIESLHLRPLLIPICSWQCLQISQFMVTYYMDRGTVQRTFSKSHSLVRRQLRRRLYQTGSASFKNNHRSSSFKNIHRSSSFKNHHWSFLMSNSPAPAPHTPYRGSQSICSHAQQQQHSNLVNCVASLFLNHRAFGMSAKGHHKIKQPLSTLLPHRSPQRTRASKAAANVASRSARPRSEARADPKEEVPALWFGRRNLACKTP